MGQHKDWLSRHLARLDPVAGELARLSPRRQADSAWQPALLRLGYDDVAGYLKERHHLHHRTMNAIAAEVGLSHKAVASALRRHGLARLPHAAARHAAGRRAAEVAARMGFTTAADYVSSRRRAGWTWNAIVAESGQSQTWLRRHGGPSPVGSTSRRGRKRGDVLTAR
jgi:AraC-like DNA-binding protein